MKIPFEIHITVQVNNVEDFKTACANCKVKPILLELHSGNDKISYDMMTSSKYIGDDFGAFQEVERVSLELNNNNFKVIRQKIETVPWHPLAPNIVNKFAMPKDCYFECHFGVLTSKKRLKYLRQLSINNGLHLSQNIFKQYLDDKVKIMSTLRSNVGTYENFMKNVNAFKNLLQKNNFSFEKEIIEFAIYDSNIKHDLEWISGELK